jgi:hypothetical protein
MPGRQPRKPRDPRKRGGKMVAALDAALQSQAAAIIDEATGEPHGAKILRGLAVLATGTPYECAKFFGVRRMSLKPRDRQKALEILEQRRFGRVPQTDAAQAPVAPVTIVNVYATSEEYRFVTEARPVMQAGPKQLEAPRDGEQS